MRTYMFEWERLRDSDGNIYYVLKSKRKNYWRIYSQADGGIETLVKVCGDSVEGRVERTMAFYMTLQKTNKQRIAESEYDKAHPALAWAYGVEYAEMKAEQMRRRAEGLKYINRLLP